MKEYKVKAKYEIELEYEVFADSAEEAVEQLHAEKVKKVISDSTITYYDIKQEKAEISFGEFTVRISDIIYDIDEEDVYECVRNEHRFLREDTEEFARTIEKQIKKTKESLPKEMVITIRCEPKELEYYIEEELSEQTDWLISTFDYEVIDIK